MNKFDLKDIDQYAPPKQFIDEVTKVIDNEVWTDTVLECLNTSYDSDKGFDWHLFFEIIQPKLNIVEIQKVQNCMKTI